MRTAQITVTDVPVALTSPESSRDSVLVHNDGGGDIFVGDSTVSDTTGFKVAVNARESFTVHAGDALYAVTAAAGTATAHVFEN